MSQKKIIVIGSDHAAFKEKEQLKLSLEGLGFLVIDVGTHSSDRADYPDYAQKLCQEIKNARAERGVLLCGSGIGVSIVANKYRGIRAALCRSNNDAEMARKHNDANVICFGARVSTFDEIKQMTDLFLTTDFEAGRHLDRLDKFKDLGE